MQEQAQLGEGLMGLCLREPGARVSFLPQLKVAMGSVVLQCVWGKAEDSIATALRMMTSFYDDCLKNLREFLPSDCACLSVHVYVTLGEIQFNSAEYLMAQF